jgi:hypothetical protein
MSGAKVRLVVAAVLFLAWLGWLGYGVAQKGKAPVVSRAQLAAASALVVAEVSVGEDGLPTPRAKVVRVVRGEGPPAGSEVEVWNLPAALPPGSDGFPGAGEYLLPLVWDGKTGRVAGLPRSPGYEPTAPARPVVYRWDDDTRAQLRGLGIEP